MSVEAMANKMITDIQQRKEEIEREDAVTAMPWLPRSVLQAQGYTTEQLDRLVETCEKKWDGEIMDSLIAFIVINTSIAHAQ